MIYEDDGKTVTINHGQDEWVLEFDKEGRCINRDPATRLLTQWISDVMELAKNKIR
ncbi:hypothetical protein [Natrinema sp. SYSU A 869]|uniref:hypothetical protein n=1 Tax=Natrinema sp. SYSU A 869 TaxID=2871694 RepID=UPI0021021120|nr:hypothetical protein [Natrinema sp. SYSU A 869]